MQPLKRTEIRSDAMSEPRHAVFATTDWNMVLSARGGSTPPVDEALGRLCGTYWPPLYTYLRRDGRPQEEAEDLVQGFFEQLLAKNYLLDVAREKGRFRSFLLAAMRHYASNVSRDQRAQKRGGGALRLGLDEPGVRERCEAAAAPPTDPEIAYDRLWAATVMERAARLLREEQDRPDRADYYNTLRTWLAREPHPGEYASAARRLGLSEGALAVAVLRMRRRFRELIRAEVARTVASPTDVDDELRHLLRVLTTP